MKGNLFYTLFFFAAALVSIAQQFELAATPAQVVLLRHAEKPSSGDSLSTQGFERAAALVNYFSQIPAPFKMEPPVALYAQASSKNHKSTRPVQTIALLANHWQLPLYVRYTAADYKMLVKDIMNMPSYEGKMVVICWSHQHLKEIAEQFGVKNPPIWPSSVYDRIWLLDFSNENVSSFQDLPQDIL